MRKVAIDYKYTELLNLYHYYLSLLSEWSSYARSFQPEEPTLYPCVSDWPTFESLLPGYQLVPRLLNVHQECVQSVLHVDSTCLDARLPIRFACAQTGPFHSLYQVKGAVLIFCEIVIDTLQVPSISVTLVLIYKSSALARK